MEIKKCGRGSAVRKIYCTVLTGAVNFSYPLPLALGMDLLTSKTSHTGPYKSIIIGAKYLILQDADSYIHRVGRTARAGQTGTALSLVAGKPFN